ncbi:bifunctional DNA-formamidopyrimidine glycosylase/DNA-(apurinic or apyrimidinic site) lyase [Planctomycetota bacterium]|nr:bifunctional DNA-formamidopyrimidine glycosylase/DNA-(apurinic or apyrimidinic site) lyase [Planctomycetota bacterium]
MPELPEVEVTRRQLAPYFEGRVIARVITTKPSYFFVTKPSTLKRKIRGRCVASLTRQGKYLIADFDNGSRLLLHLGMTGQLFVQGASSLRLLQSTANATLTPDDQSAFTPDRHTHLRFVFDDDGPEVWFRDVRKFGKVEWLAKGETCKRLEKLGVDALEADDEVFWNASRRRNVPVKTLLLNQSVLAGIGNIYADEALFLARVRPSRKAAKISRRESKAITRHAREVMLRSIETGGSSISDYINPNGQDGGFQDERKVYGLEGEPCPTCRTPIKRVVISQRSSHFCPKCQK